MKAHRTDGLSLAFGIVFLAIFAWWLLTELLDLAVPAVGWFIAGGLILLGVLGLLAALRSGGGGPTAAEPHPTATDVYAGLADSPETDSASR